jgi:hypothetical protein
MRVKNFSVADAMYAEQRRRNMSGSFGYGDFGLRDNEGVTINRRQMGSRISAQTQDFSLSQELQMGAANADRIIDEANMSWTDQQINSAKAKWRELELAVKNTVNERNATIAAIKAMPASPEKNLAIGSFTDADSIFAQAYATLAPLVRNVTDADLPVAEQANFGLFFLPAVAIAAKWAVVAAAIVTVGYIITAMNDSRLKYQAIQQNPEVAKYVDTSSGFLPSILGSNGTYLAIGAAVLGVLFFMKK